MTLIVTFHLDNAAFYPDPATEAARILRELARRVEAGALDLGTLPVRDVNGNRVGTLEVRP